MSPQVNVGLRALKGGSTLEKDSYSRAFARVKRLIELRATSGGEREGVPLIEVSLLNHNIYPRMPDLSERQMSLPVGV